MRPNTVLAERTGELGGVKHAMSFDENSVAHLMSVLTDLYSDPELAVIREYSTNALDSHIAAGVDRPIEITLPNGLSPFFKIRDYGTGMDASDIETIYSKYGASTKRESDTQVGMPLPIHNSSLLLL
jgi:sensor histidine kinase regulating citrate/malate metabolism